MASDRITVELLESWGGCDYGIGCGRVFYGKAHVYLVDRYKTGWLVHVLDVSYKWPRDFSLIETATDMRALLKLLGCKLKEPDR